jgi:acyl carrier protein
MEAGEPKAEQGAKRGAKLPGALQRGLAPEEGLGVLERLLSQPVPARVVVSTVDLGALEDEIFARMEQLRAPAPAARPAHPRPDLATPYVAPRNPSEERLAEIFQQVLGIERVGVDDSFFELGGDSVIAIQVIARAGQEGFQLSPNDLFQHPSVAQLVERAGSGEAPATTRLPPIEATEGEVLPLSLNQERYWARYRRGGASASLNLPLAVGFVGRLNLPVLASSLQQILDRHEAMRTRFRQSKAGAQQVVLAHLRLRMPLVDLSRLPEEVSKVEARRLRDHEASHVFDLEREILFRITLIRRSPEEHELFVIKHHLITDGWSGGLFAQELAELYAAKVEAREPRLPRLPVRYGDYALWQREHLVAGGVLAEQLEHWRAELDGGEFPILELPGDHPRQGGGGFPSEDIFRQLPAEPYEALKTFARAHNVTPFMVQLAALNILLAAYAGQRDIALTTDVANRDRVETEPLIGLFTNVLVLRNDLSGNPTVEELLERTRSSTVRSFDHQVLPFADLMGALKPGWLEAYHQVFPVAFVFQNYPGRSFSLPGLELRSLEIDPGAVSRDLLVITGETGDGLRVAFRYRTDFFEASTVERLVKDYLGLLRSLPEDPARRLSDLLAPLSSPAPAR